MSCGVKIYRVNKLLIVAFKHNNSTLFTGLFIMEATCLSHSWPSSGSLIEPQDTISAYLCIMEFHITYIKMYIKFNMLKVA